MIDLKIKSILMWCLLLRLIDDVLQIESERDREIVSEVEIFELFVRCILEKFSLNLLFIDVDLYCCSFKCVMWGFNDFYEVLG